MNDPRPSEGSRQTEWNRIQALPFNRGTIEGLNNAADSIAYSMRNSADEPPHDRQLHAYWNSMLD